MRTLLRIVIIGAVYIGIMALSVQLNMNDLEIFLTCLASGAMLGLVL